MSVFHRDHWLCYLCKRPVIFPPAMKYLQRELELARFPDLAYWQYANNRQFAPLLDELAAVIDHLQPYSKGGGNNPENLRTACNKCNSRKSDSEYINWIRQNPSKKNRGKEPLTWDGFSSLFLYYARRDPTRLTPIEKEWQAALTKPLSNEESTG